MDKTNWNKATWSKFNYINGRVVTRFWTIKEKAGTTLRVSSTGKFNNVQEQNSDMEKCNFGEITQLFRIPLIIPSSFTTKYN